MERITLDDVAPDAVEGGAERRDLTESLGTADLAVVHYRLAPGERASGLHAHLDQEEVFLVVDGQAEFETLDGEVEVEAGEAVRFAPGEYHSGAIASDAAGAAILAIGAPRESEEVRIPLPCSDCGHDARRPGLDGADGTPVLLCQECGTEADATCPACGSVEMQAVLDDDGTPVGVCRDCGGVTEE